MNNSRCHHCGGEAIYVLKSGSLCEDHYLIEISLQMDKAAQDLYRKKCDEELGIYAK